MTGYWVRNMREKFAAVSKNINYGKNKVSNQAGKG